MSAVVASRGTMARESPSLPRARAASARDRASSARSALNSASTLPPAAASQSSPLTIRSARSRTRARSDLRLIPLRLRQEAFGHEKVRDLLGSEPMSGLVRVRIELRIDPKLRRLVAGHELEAQVAKRNPDFLESAREDVQQRRPFGGALQRLVAQRHHTEARTVRSGGPSQRKDLL